MPSCHLPTPSLSTHNPSPPNHHQPTKHRHRSRATADPAAITLPLHYSISDDPAALLSAAHDIAAFELQLIMGAGPGGSSADYRSAAVPSAGGDGRGRDSGGARGLGAARGRQQQLGEEGVGGGSGVAVGLTPATTLAEVRTAVRAEGGSR